MTEPKGRQGALTLDKQTAEWLEELNYIKHHPYRFTQAIDVADAYVHPPQSLRVLIAVAQTCRYGGAHPWFGTHESLR